MAAGTENPTLGERFHPGPIGSASGAQIFQRAARILLLWTERATQRRHLSNLTPWELDDVGISREAASREAAKPFWQA